MILLIRKELDRLWQKYEKEDPLQSTSWDEFLIKAQLRKMVEWRNEECTEHSHTINISGFNHKVIVMHNDCERCWQALLKEME